MRIVTSWPGFLTKWHTYWGRLFELPWYTKEPVPTSSGDSDTVPSHKEYVLSHKCVFSYYVIALLVLLVPPLEQHSGFADQGSGSHCGRKHTILNHSHLPMATT